MTTVPRDFDKAAVREFRSVVLGLLHQRKQELQNGTRLQGWWKFPRGVEPKRFTYEQCRRIYGSFAELQRDELKTPPSRTTIMELAEYLETTLTERNHLLRICHYALVPPYTSGEALAPVLDVANQVLRSTFLPAYVINRDWDIYIVNAPILKLIGLSPADYYAIPRDEQNIIQLIFDPHLPVRAQIEHEHGNWEYIAARNVFGFKYENMFCEFEDWYNERKERWMKLPGFLHLWQSIDVESSFGYQGDGAPFPFYRTTIRTHAGLVTFRSLLTSFGNYDYPQIVSYQPLDETSCAVYHDLSITLSEPVLTYSAR